MQSLLLGAVRGVLCCAMCGRAQSMSKCAILHGSQCLLQNTVSGQLNCGIDEVLVARGLQVVSAVSFHTLPVISLQPCALCTYLFEYIHCTCRIAVIRLPCLLAAHLEGPRYEDHCSWPIILRSVWQCVSIPILAKPTMMMLLLFCSQAHPGGAPRRCCSLQACGSAQQPSTYVQRSTSKRQVSLATKTTNCMPCGRTSDAATNGRVKVMFSMRRATSSRKFLASLT